LLVNCFMVQGQRQANTQNRQAYRYVVYCIAFVVLLCCALFVTSCTKPDEVKPIVVDTLPPPPSGPSGSIQEFSVQDTLVGHGMQTVIKWYVNGTNSLTEVRLNGEKVLFSGAMQSGPLTKNTVFTLSINNNKQSSQMIYVADSMATILWNEGRRWRTTDTRTMALKVIKGSLGQDSTIEVWENTFASFNGKYEHFRTSFDLYGNSKEEQIFTNFPQPNPSGKYVVVQVNNAPTKGTGHAMFWKSNVYYIDTLSISGKQMVLYVDTAVNGRQTFNRIRYTPEF
jgi:hypothetical protein